MSDGPEVIVIACCIAADTFHKEKLPGDGQDWVNRNHHSYIPLAKIIWSKLEKIANSSLPPGKSE